MRVRRYAGKSPRFGARVFVASSAVIVGDVDLADDVSVWYGAVLRGDLEAIRIGARSNVQDQAVIHVDHPDLPAILGEDVTVGHGAILHGCRVERGALVGIGATVLNGAVVGEEAMVAAGAVVPPGMTVTPRTLVAGVPARARRELTPEELAANRRTILSYLEVKSRCLAEDEEVGASDPSEWERLS